MTTSRAETQGVDQSDLTIGELARRTGLTPPVIRMWETRHGFPVPHRLPSGHRRYAEDDVERILHVLRRRDAGIRLDVAIAEAAATTPPETPSVFAELRRRHPHLPVHRLRKSTLLALSWAIEDECAARAQRAVLFGSFQRERYWRGSIPRWRELSRITRAAVAIAEFDSPAQSGSRVVRVHVDDDHPMRREWAVVCDAPEAPAVLTAWELPGQTEVKDRDRLFEGIWTVEPQAVREAARVCAQVTQASGQEIGGRLLYELADDPPGRVDPIAASLLLNRVVAYIDRLA